MHAKIALKTYLQFRICIPANKITLKLSICPHEALMTNSSTSVWSQKKRSPCKGERKLSPADFLRGRPNSASNEYTTLPLV